MKRSFRISKRVRVPRERAFDIVNDVQRYPEFLPNVKRVEIREEKSNERVVEIEFKHPVLSSVLISRAKISPPSSIEIEQIEGLSKAFRLHWKFTSLDQKSSRITVDVEIEFDSRLLSVVLGNAIEKMIEDMVARFEKRAVM